MHSVQFGNVVLLVDDGRVVGAELDFSLADTLVMVSNDRIIFENDCFRIEYDLSTGEVETTKKWDFERRETTRGVECSLEYDFLERSLRMLSENLGKVVASIETICGPRPAENVLGMTIEEFSDIVQNEQPDIVDELVDAYVRRVCPEMFEDFDNKGDVPWCYPYVSLAVNNYSLGRIRGQIIFKTNRAFVFVFRDDHFHRLEKMDFELEPGEELFIEFIPIVFGDGYIGVTVKTTENILSEEIKIEETPC